MSGQRQVQATLVAVQPRLPRGDPAHFGAAPWAESGAREEEAAALGVELRFQPERSRTIVDPIDDFASLGPAYCVPAVRGLGKVLRILRAARIAPPEDPETLLGDPARAAALLERALGTTLVLALRPRSSVRFVAWTEDGIETVDDVEDVIETEDAYLVFRRLGRYAVRLPRAGVVRRQSEATRWYEVLGIE